MYRYGYQQPPASVEALFGFSHAFHTMRGHIALAADAISGVHMPLRCSVLRRFGFSVDDFGASLLVLLLWAAAFRALSLVLLLVTTRRG